MDMNVLIAVAVIWGIAAITPGPNFFIVVHTAIDAGQKYSLFTVLGIVAGTFIWALSGYFGVSLLFTAIPILYFTVKLMGGLYLTYLGCKLLLKKSDEAAVRPRKKTTAASCFRLGLLTNLLNPKTAAFMTSLFAATFPQDASVQLGAASVMVVCAISALWYSLVSTAFSHAKAQAVYDRQKRKIEKLAGTIFIAFGLKLTVSS